MDVREPAVQVGLNVVGGMIAVALVDAFRWLRTRLRARRFRAIFGDDTFATGAFGLVYAPFALRNEVTECLRQQGPELADFPYTKPGLIGVGISTTDPVSSAELRAANYLTRALAAARAPAPALLQDYREYERLDMSFVALGGPCSNLKTSDVLSNDANGLVTVQPPAMGARFVSVQGRRPLQLDASEGDLGLVLKIHPMQFPHRTWIACAGIGEYGTSGGAWFLANKWEEIRKRAGSGPFAVIVRVRPGQDESATPILTATCADDLRSFVADGEIAEEYAPASIAQPAAMAELLGSGSIVTTSQSFPTLTAPASGTVTPRSGGSEAPSGPALPPRDPKKRGK